MQNLNTNDAESINIIEIGDKKNKFGNITGCIFKIDSIAIIKYPTANIKGMYFTIIKNTLCFDNTSIFYYFWIFTFSHWKWSYFAAPFCF